MISLFDNISIFHHKNHICIFNCRQSMRNNKARSSFHQVIHRLLDKSLCTSIYRRCCLIKNHYLAVCQNSSCDSKELFLSLRHITCIFIKFHVVTARKCSDKAVCMSCFCCLDNFFICCIQTSITDIFHNSSFIEPCIL